MGILEQVVGGLMGGNGSGSSPMQNVLMGLLAGRSGTQAVQGGGQAGGFDGPGGELGTMLGRQGAAAGLAGLVSAFENAGLGHLVQSWVGAGPNQPVSPEQLRSVFGDGQARAMAREAGMDEGDFLSQLSHHLPAAVDGVTSRDADDGTVSV